MPSIKLGWILVLVLSTNQYFQCAQVQNPAQPKAPISAASELPVNLPQQKSNSSVELTESQAYKLLYQDSKDANNRIIGTMQWSVGIGAAFLLTLVGSQVFFNYRLGKEELAAIRSDNAKLISELANTLRSELAQKISSIETINEARRNELMKLLDERAELSKTKMESIESDLNSKITEIEIDLEEATGHIWHLRGVKSNALSRFIATAILKIETDNGNPEYILNDILSILKQVDDIHTRDREELDKLVLLVPDNLKELRDEIQALFKTKPIYSFSPEIDQTTGKRVRYKKVYKSGTGPQDT